MSEVPATVTEALAAWLAALAARGTEATVAAAVAPDILIERASGLGRHAGEVVELITGAENAARWFALSPASLRFEVAGEAVEVDGDGVGSWQVAYRVTGEDFENGGLWRFRLDPAGRIAWLRHVPRPLGGAAAEEVRDPAPWRTYVKTLETHDHDHGHGPEDPHA